MASITSAGTGNWSAGGTWVGGVAPVLGDKVTIASGHVVTVDTTGLAGGDDTSTGINVNGTLRFSRTASSELRVRGDMVIGSTGELDMGKTGDLIPAAHQATLQLNDSAALGVGKWILRIADRGAKCYFGGAARTRNATLTATASATATSCSVDDATGWTAGDLICFEATGSVTTEQEVKTILSISGTGPYTINWTGGLSFSHASGSKVGNLSSNVLVRAYSASHNSGVDLGATYTGTEAADKVQLQNVAFWYIGANGGQFPDGVKLGRAELAGRYGLCNGIALYQYDRCAFTVADVRDTGLTISNVAAYSSVHAASSGCFQWEAASNPILDGWVFYRHGNVFGGFIQPTNSVLGLTIRNTVFGAYGSGGYHFYMPFSVASPIIMERCRHMSATALFAIAASFSVISRECDYGLGSGSGGVGSPSCGRLVAWPFASYVANTFTLIDERHGTFTTEFEPLPAGSLSGRFTGTRFVFANSQRNPLTQNTRTPLGSITRDNVNAYDASGSCLRCEPVSATQPLTYTFQILAPTGSSVLVAGFAKRSTSGVTFEVTMSGLGITPVTQTLSGATGAGTWQQWSLAAVQSSGADSLLTVTIKVSGTSGNCLVDQIVAPPTKAITTGDLGLWYDGLPANLVVANYVSALDIWSMQTSQLTLAGSVGKLVTDNVNATISSRLAAAGYTAPDNAGITTLLARLTALRAAALDNLDATVSSRLAGAGYTAPDNAAIAAIVAYVDELEARLTAPRAAALDNLDATITSRLAAAGYTAPDNARLVLVEKILRNKTITDPVAGTIKVFDDDGTTVLLQGALWEDAAASQGYRGQGADRRERLA